MKNSIWHLSFVLLAGLGLASIPTLRTYGQDTPSEPTATTEQSTPETGSTHQAQGDQSTAAMPTSQNGHRVIVLGTLPEGYVAPSEEVERYMYFFEMLRSWDTLAKRAENSGDSGWAEYYRTKLAKESGLTEEQADQVKKIVYQHLQDEQASGQRVEETNKKSGAYLHRPDPGHGQKLVITPEQAALRQEHWDLVNKAIAQLVSTLGSRPFSKLDLYTRHMDDRMKTQQAPRKTAEGSEGGVK